MSFFEAMGRKLSDAGQTSAQKAKDLADMAKYNSLILDAEKTISGLYQQIGEKYVEKHVDELEPEMEELVNAIQEAKDKIKEYQHVLGELKGLKECPSCGTQVAMDAVFCPACGTNLAKAYKAETKEEEDAVVVDATEVEEDLADDVSEE